MSALLDGVSAFLAGDPPVPLARGIRTLGPLGDASLAATFRLDSLDGILFASAHARWMARSPALAS